MRGEGTEGDPRPNIRPEPGKRDISIMMMVGCCVLDVWDVIAKYGS